MPMYNGRHAFAAVGNETVAGEFIRESREDRMDSLKIQDVFEPYYAGRKRFAPRKDKSRPAQADDSKAEKLLERHLVAETRPTNETDSTTEH
jgi:hypothetical protein